MEIICAPGLLFELQGHEATILTNNGGNHMSGTRCIRGMPRQEEGH